MLSVFTVPKPFRGHIGLIQRNAVRSWTLLRPACEVLLLGDEEGTSEVAKELGVAHLPEVPRNRHGTPLVNGLFELAQKRAKHPLLAYVNADIVLLGDFTSAVSAVAREKSCFLIGGQRWDLDVREPLRFEDGWEEQLRAKVSKEGKLHPVTGIDYFVFPRGLWSEIPPFAVGRTAWDNWLLYGARKAGAPLVDATAAVTAVHQNHDYAHVSGGEAAVWNGPEAAVNRELSGEAGATYTLLDATLLLTPRGLTRPLDRAHLVRRADALALEHPLLKPLLRLARSAWGLARRFRTRLGETNANA
ncbi:MAG: hypothetical protein HYZ28_01620 [Myxococcales bacterium]|nr:hypothetical protein [Myxococcales bacterium]